MPTVVILVAGLVVAVVVCLATAGHVVFLPILLLLPVGLFSRRRR
jgi:hypothetical protein